MKWSKKKTLIHAAPCVVCQVCRFAAINLIRGMRFQFNDDVIALEPCDIDVCVQRVQRSTRCLVSGDGSKQRFCISGKTQGRINAVKDIANMRDICVLYLWHVSKYRNSLLFDHRIELIAAAISVCHISINGSECILLMLSILDSSTKAARKCTHWSIKNSSKHQHTGQFANVPHILSAFVGYNSFHSTDIWLSTPCDSSILQWTSKKPLKSIVWSLYDVSNTVSLLAVFRFPCWPRSCARLEPLYRTHQNSPRPDRLMTLLQWCDLLLRLNV